jgi:putative PIN family toxin of toxin-antitoxin system
MKVVLDADVLVAALRSRRGASAAWLRAGLRREVEMLASVPLMLHYEAVIMRPEHQTATALSARELSELLDAIAAVATPVTISYLWRPMLRDPDDELVLETAVNGDANLLLTFNERDYGGAWSFAPIVSRPGPALRGWLEGSR